MKKLFLSVSVIIIATLLNLSGQVAPWLRYDKNESLPYDEVIAAYKQMDKDHKTARLVEMGKSDIGKPIHLFLISGDGDFDPASLKKKGKTIILINNGIHPGEPEGIDASIQYSWNLLYNKKGTEVLKNTVIAIIPVYNIGGTLNRSPYFRLNQNGPVEKGARRNATNLDLNRDFAKQDSHNARTFAAIWQFLQPDVFLDTHTTNGSDHQFTLTLLPTQYQRMEEPMGKFFIEVMEPELYSRMKKNSVYGMIPYVQFMERGKISSILGFEDHPYYSTGYASMFNSFAFMTENLVYKPFPERVNSVVDFIGQLTSFTSDYNSRIRTLRAEAIESTRAKREYVLDWKMDTTIYRLLEFKGYEYEMTTTPLTGRPTGIYNREKPRTDTIKYFYSFLPQHTVKAPDAYIVPQGWENVISRLRINGVVMKPLPKDTTMLVESYYIESSEADKRSTQGHYVNSRISLRTETGERKFYAGDMRIELNQVSNKYIVALLEPEGPASFLRWNFFDAVLEGQDFFSIWGFESHAKELLDKDEELASQFEERRRNDPDFASDPVAQLQFIYQKAPHSIIEKSNFLYPVARVYNSRER